MYSCYVIANKSMSSYERATAFCGIVTSID